MHQPGRNREFSHVDDKVLTQSSEDVYSEKSEGRQFCQNANVRLEDIDFQFFEVTEFPHPIRDTLEKKQHSSAFDLQPQGNEKKERHPSNSTGLLG